MLPEPYSYANSHAHTHAFADRVAHTYAGAITIADPNDPISYAIAYAAYYGYAYNAAVADLHAFGDTDDDATARAVAYSDEGAAPDRAEG